MPSQKYEARIENPAENCCSIYADEQLGVSNHGACKTKHEPLLYDIDPCSPNQCLSFFSAQDCSQATSFKVIVDQKFVVM